MVDFEQEIKIIWGNNRKIYEPLGYIYTNKGDVFNVKLKDLAKQSSKEINVICDYCGNSYFTKYYSYNRFNKNLKINKDACFNCRHKKRFESNLSQYGSKSHNTNKKTFNEVAEDFDQRNLILIDISDNKITSQTRMFYKCKTHFKTVESMTYASFKCGVGCKYCAIENNSKLYRKSFKEVKSEFKKRNLLLVSNHYDNYYTVLDYICLEHFDKGIQKTTYASLHKNKFGCPYCAIENNSGINHHNWNGGITPISNYFREVLSPWVFDSLKQYNFKCALSGINDKTLEVHHLYSYTDILNNILVECGLNSNCFMGDFSQEQIKLVSKNLLDRHYELGFGVPLRKILHQKFHQEYSYHNNMPQQFEEFKARFEAGEFDAQLAL